MSRCLKREHVKMSEPARAPLVCYERQTSWICSGAAGFIPAQGDALGWSATNSIHITLIHAKQHSHYPSTCQTALTLLLYTLPLYMPNNNLYMPNSTVCSGQVTGLNQSLLRITSGYHQSSGYHRSSTDHNTYL